MKKIPGSGKVITYGGYAGFRLAEYYTGLYVSAGLLSPVLYAAGSRR